MVFDDVVMSEEKLIAHVVNREKKPGRDEIRCEKRRGGKLRTMASAAPYMALTNGSRLFKKFFAS